MTPQYIFELKLKVRDYEADAEGIVNNANYLHYLEHTRHEFCEHAGLSFRAMIEQGMTPVVRHIDITYLNSLRLGDTFVSRLALRRQGPRFIFIQDIFRLPDNLHVVKARVTSVAVENGHITRGDRLAEAFADYIR